MSNLREILSGVKKKSLTDILAPVKSPVKQPVPTLEQPIQSAITQAVGQVRSAPAPQLPKTLAPEVKASDSLVSQLKPFTESAQQKRADIQEDVKSLRTADLPGIRKLPVAKTQQQLKEAERFGVTLLPPTPKDPEYKGFQESFAKFTAEEQPFGAGLVKEITPFAQKLPTVGPALERAEEEAPFAFKAGEVTGKTAEMLGGYLAGSGIVSKLAPGLVGAQGFAAKQGVSLLLDTIAQTPFEVVEFVNNDQTATDDVKQFVKNRAVDAAFNLAFGVGGELAKGISELRKLRNSNDPVIVEAINNAAKNLTEAQQKTIQEELGLAPETTAKEFLEEQRKVAEDVGIETMFRQFEEPTEQLVKQAPELFPRAVEPSPQLRQTLEQVRPTQVTPEVPRVEPSPRLPDIVQPQVGTSQARFPQGRDLTTKELSEELRRLELATTSNEARTQLARETVDRDFETAVRMVKEGDQFGSGVESEIGRDLVTKLQQQGRDAEAVEIIEALSKKFRRAGQDVQAASIWARSTPEGMQKWATNTLNNAEVEVDPTLIKEVGEDMRLISQMTPEELAQAVAQRLGRIGESESIRNQILQSNSFDQLKAINTAITMDKVFSKIPVAKARTLSTIQSMSHLLNARTFLRNIFGNTASITGEVTSRIPASLADRALSMFTGNRSVVAKMPKFKQSLNEGWEQGQRSFFEISAGVGKGKRDKYDLLFGSAFKSKTGKQAEKLLSLSLQTPDEFFKGFTKADSLYNQVRARLGKSVDNLSFDEIMEKATIEEIEAAAKEAEFATFQNDSALAEFMSKTKTLLNRVHIDPTKKFLKESGEFGLGDLTLKYTRVPGNIITRGLEYSPLGYLKLGAHILDPSALKNLTPQQQREIAMQFGRATTGTGLLGLGYILNKAGIITGTETSRDFDVQAFDRAEGLGDYKINVSALERLITGGSAQPQEGDTIKSYNWAQPMTTPIAVGARIASEDPETAVDVVNAVKQSTIDEALDLPTLFVVKKMMYEGMRGDATPQDILSVPVKEALPGFIPSVVRQAAQTIDPTVRETTTAQDPFVARLQANIPVLSKQLPPRLDPLGREVTRQPGIVPNLIDPAAVSTFQPTGFGDQLREISDLSGKTTVFPDRKPPNSVTIRGNKVELTQDEKQRWQRTEGQYVNDQYLRLLGGQTITDEAQAIRFAKRLEEIKRQAGELAKRELIQNRR